MYQYMYFLVNKTENRDEEIEHTIKIATLIDDTKKAKL